MSKRVFLSYAAADEAYREELETHLAPLKRSGAAVVWGAHMLSGGEVERQVIEAQLAAADVILLLVTPHFLASDMIQDEQVQRALHRSETAGTRVVPILVRECSWEASKLAKLEPLPKNREPVTSWTNRDKAWKEVVAAVRAVLEEEPASVRLGAHTAAGGRVTGVFVGRERELALLRSSLLPNEGAPRPVAVCAVHGMAGVGKSYLADKFAADHAADFPGGTVRLVLRPGEQAKAPSEDALLAEIARQLDLSGAPNVKRVSTRLRNPRTLLHIENADSPATATSAARIATQLPQCAVIVTGRYRELGRSVGFVQVDVSILTEDRALDLFALEMGRSIAPAERIAYTRLGAALGYLPLALSLAAGYLREDYTPGLFLDLFRSDEFHTAPLDPAHPALLADQARAIVGRAFALSLDLLHAAICKDTDRLIDGFFALGHAPASGFGPSLGAAIAGLSEPDFLRLALLASRHSLLDRVAGQRARWTLHPLLAEMGRLKTNAEAVFDRMTEWFVARLKPDIDDRGVVRGPRWAEVQDETAALVAWLPAVRESDLERIERAGSQFAMRHGPFVAWQRFCERSLTQLQEPRARSNVLFTLGYVASSAGDLDRALEAAKQKVTLDRSQGWLSEAAGGMGKIADILQARGQLDEALRIRREESLPVYEQLGDVRSLLIGRCNIAAILLERAAAGDRDEAERLLQIAWEAANALGLPEADAIRSFQVRHGFMSR